jgi:thiazole synthase
MMEDILEIDGVNIKCRLFAGTGKFSSNALMREALLAAGVDVVTVALRRVDSSAKAENILDYVPSHCKVMINTSGARNAEEAIRIARLAKAAGAGNWSKIEVVADSKYLLPDNMETLKATEVLAKEGFVVFPYMSPDLSMARRFVDCGAAAVMPLGSPIGTNRGIRTEELVEIMIREIKTPIIVDAGLGKPSDACKCMEMGCAAVMVNTAIAVSGNPVELSRAFSMAVDAGRRAYLSGLPATATEAKASSPLTGFLREGD